MTTPRRKATAAKRKGTALRDRDRWRSTQRRAVGRSLLDGPLGEGRIVKAIAGDSGNTSRLLKAMARDGLVEVESDGRPRIWRLAPGQDGTLRARLEREQPPGGLSKGQRVLLVSLGAGGETMLAHALRSKALLGGVVWVARIEGADGQYLIVLDRDAPALEASVLSTTLDRAGIGAIRMLVEEVLPTDAFVRSLAMLRGVRSEPPA
jgi:hypothetical protein